MAGSRFFARLRLPALALWAGIALAQGASAAPSFTPRAGAWAFDPELNGQPGRGMQIDVQGETLVMTMYGYDSAGRGTFYLTAGQLVDNTFSGDMLFYSDGKTFGGMNRDAVLGGSAGIVTMLFVDGTRGVITLPGEPAKSISKLRFGFVDEPDALLGDWYQISLVGAGTESSRMNLVDLVASTSSFNGMAATAGVAERDGCARNVDGRFLNRVVCQRFAANASPHLYFVDYSGHAGSGADYVSSDVTVRDAYLLRSLTASGRNTGGRLTTFQPAPSTFTPQSGAWAIDSELNGRPGRGMQIDVENDILVLTLYAYDATGRGTFYLTAGQLDANGHFSGELKFYDQGTPLGGTVRNAREAGTAGTVELDFSDGAHGTIRLPGEPTLAISKLNFGVPEGVEGLLGEWLFVYDEAGSIGSHRMVLDFTEQSFGIFAQGLARSTADSDVLCGRNASRGSSYLECQILGSNGSPTDYYFWEMSGNAGDGLHHTTATGIQSPMRAWRIRTAQGRSTLTQPGFSTDGLTVAHVQYFSEEGVGTFDMTSSGAWIETAPLNARAFTFREDRRDTSSVYLVDDSRNFGIQLDLFTREVKFSSTGTGPYSRLYPIVMAK